MTVIQPRPLRQVRKKLVYARQRYLIALLAKPCAIVCASALAIELVFTATGSRALWQTCVAGLVLLPGLGVLAFRLRNRFHSLYRTAQILDARAGLQDRVSTAWYLLQAPAHAENAAAIAHIAEATRRIDQVQWRDVFPLPRKTLAVAASIVVLLILTSVASLKNETTRFSKTIAGQLHQNPWKPSSGSNAAANFAAVAAEKDFPHEEAAGRRDVTAKRAAPGEQQAQSPQAGEQPQFPGTEADGKDQQDGLEHASPSTDQRQKTSAPTLANRQPAAAHGNSAEKDHRQGEPSRAGETPARSFVSDLLSPLKRLFGAEQGHENQTRANSAVESSRLPDDSKRTTNKDEASTAAVAQDQQPALPGGAQYGSADPSAKQAPSKNPVGLPASIPTAELRSLSDTVSKSIPPSSAESVAANGNGELGHTRVQASRGDVGHSPAHSFHFEQHQDATQLNAREDVPLAYRNKIQAYLEAARDQPQTPDGQGNRF